MTVGTRTKCVATTARVGYKMHENKAPKSQQLPCLKPWTLSGHVQLPQQEQLRLGTFNSCNCMSRTRPETESYLYSFKFKTFIKYF